MTHAAKILAHCQGTFDVESITFEIVFKSGRVKRAEFIRSEKTLELLRDDGSLGDFLRGLVKQGE